jgi:branched-chain amino acid transport system permease protein
MRVEIIMIKQWAMRVISLRKDRVGKYLPQIILGVLILLLPHLISSFWVLTVTEVFIFGLYATSFNLLLGYGGMLSFGHAAYFGIGAYTAALLMKAGGLPMPLAFLLAPFASMIAAGVFGFFCVRLKGIYFAMLTFSFQMLIYTVIFKWYSFTGGDDGISGIFASAFIGGPIKFYYFAIIFVALGLLGLHAIVSSPFGYALKAVRESPLRGMYVGINVTLYRWVAFGLAGFFAGLAGALYAFSKESVFPDWLYWTASAIPIFMSVLGGLQAFLGPVVGAIVYVLMETIITGYTEYWPMIMGIILLSLAVLLPKGLLSLIERWPRARRHQIDHK